jgi:acyl carrier protein phosphodiesterase
MSILNSIAPTKEKKQFEVELYTEDMELFNHALSFLQSEHRGASTFTQEALFEHIMSPLRSDQDLQEYIEKSRKKKRPKAKKSIDGFKQMQSAETAERIVP